MEMVQLPERKIQFHLVLLVNGGNQHFLICYLAVPQPTLGHLSTTNLKVNIISLNFIKISGNIE